MGSFVRFTLVRERTHVSGTLNRFASSAESITSFSFMRSPSGFSLMVEEMGIEMGMAKGNG
jgi:hypothetical protein